MVHTAVGFNEHLRRAVCHDVKQVASVALFDDCVAVADEDGGKGVHNDFGVFVVQALEQDGFPHDAPDFPAFVVGLWVHFAVRFPLRLQNAGVYPRLGADRRAAPPAALRAERRQLVHVVVVVVVRVRVGVVIGRRPGFTGASRRPRRRRRRRRPALRRHLRVPRPVAEWNKQEKENGKTGRERRGDTRKASRRFAADNLGE